MATYYFCLHRLSQAGEHARFTSRDHARQLTLLASDSVLAQRSGAHDATGIEAAADALRTAVAQLRLAFGSESRRAMWGDVLRRREVAPALCTTSA